MKRVESYPEGGLIVVRGGIDPVLASDFQEEWIGQLNERDLARLNGQIDNLQVAVFAKGHSQDNVLTNPQLGATGRILESLGLNHPDDDEFNVTVNYQPAQTAQSFHKDNKTWDDTVIIVHGGPNGAFDYAPEVTAIHEAEVNYNTISLDLGDIVFQSKPYMLHRGRNSGEKPRVTVAFAKVVEELFSDSSR